MNIKFKKSTYYLITYIFIIFLMSLIYWKITVKSNGDDFSFNKDIILTKKVNKFKSKFNTNIDNNYIENLINSYNEYDLTVRLGETKENSLLFKIGEKDLKKISFDWAYYYYTNMYNQGYNYISYEVGDGVEIFDNNEYIQIILKFAQIPENKINRTSPSQYIKLDSAYEKYITESNTFNVYVDKIRFTENLDWRRNNCSLYPISESMHLLLNSINYLGDEYDYVKELNSNIYSYEYIDFLYFSAITATTLGYGDILPNSKLVRILVALETVFEVIIMGIFISLKFKELND